MVFVAMGRYKRLLTYVLPTAQLLFRKEIASKTELNADIHSHDLRADIVGYQKNRSSFR